TEIGVLEPGSLNVPPARQTGSFVLDSIARELPPLSDYDDSVWDGTIQEERLKETLAADVRRRAMEWYQSAAAHEPEGGRTHVDAFNTTLADQLNRESCVAAYLLYLKSNAHFAKLKDLFYKEDASFQMLLQLLQFRDPLEMFDPFNDIE